MIEKKWKFHLFSIFCTSVYKHYAESTFIYFSNSFILWSTATAKTKQEKNSFTVYVSHTINLCVECTWVKYFISYFFPFISIQSLFFELKINMNMKWISSESIDSTVKYNEFICASQNMYIPFFIITISIKKQFFLISPHTKKTFALLCERGVWSISTEQFLSYNFLRYYYCRGEKKWVYIKADKGLT